MTIKLAYNLQLIITDIIYQLLYKSIVPVIPTVHFFNEIQLYNLNLELYQ